MARAQYTPWTLSQCSFFCRLLITDTVWSAWRIELSFLVPAWGRTASPVGGFHWAKGLPLRVVAGAVLQDVLRSLVLQTAGAQDYCSLLVLRVLFDSLLILAWDDCFHDKDSLCSSRVGGCLRLLVSCRVGGCRANTGTCTRESNVGGGGVRRSHLFSIRRR